MERIYKNSGDLEHQYAFNEFGQVVHINDAKRIINGAKVKYFLFQDFSNELILKAEDSFKKRKHFALKVNFVEYNGRKYFGDPSTESPQHYDAKLKIVKQGYFEWGEYKIPVKNCKLERRYGKSYFRSDLIAEMKSGDKIFIEIVKTSNISKSKEQFIIKNQLTTFKIYIDENGSFEFDKFEIIGNDEIESLRNEYRKKYFEFEQSKSRNDNAWSRYYQEKNHLEREIKEYENKINQEIQRYFEGIQQRIKYQAGKKEIITEKIRECIKNSKSLQNKFRENLDYRHGLIMGNIRQYRSIGRDIERIKSRIKSIETIGNEIQGMESLFIQIEPLVKWEWIEPGCNKEPKGQDRLFQLKYLLT